MNLHQSPDLFYIPPPPSTSLKLIEGVHAMRAKLYAQGLAIAADYNAKREQAAAGQFCNLNLMVRDRSNGRSIQMYWVLMHFRGGKRTGVTNLPKPRSTSDFDLATIRRNCPEWMHEIATQSELQVRPVRHALARLTSVERELRVVARLTNEDLSPLYGDEASEQDSHPDADTIFPEE